MKFQERTAIITGGTGALGSLLVQTFRHEGAAVAIPVHRQHTLDTLEKSPAESLQKLLPIPADLVSQKDVHAFVQRVLDEWKCVDFLIHTVGAYAGGKRVEEVTEEEWDKLMDVNLKTAFLMCGAVLPPMRSRGFGRIITIGAMPALRPMAKRGPYQISKRALITLTETIAEEVKGSGITANTIVPSTILTPDTIESMPDADHSKWVPPDEIAALAAYLCSAEARSVNGNAIKIFGGA
ncbi:SDR family oxidoreductase [bacterium]|nr:MAG: SDR family oxidoreductase [bacterium]